ncbi:hypothetical protein GCM10012286_70230 [Streptomyces lasiicapitis]|uniref:Uncharacterized protein n=1 Tax=Streptomyces lasiicapitis TaxID=1923961 RepID=A0ABQ2MRQ6_9ACTN|nr:hypothetical protein GCM10012286_70230 [Streptomyces lasiicapitis]
MPLPDSGLFFMLLKASTRPMPVSRPETTECPMPAAASTPTDRVVATRLAQRGRRARAAGLAAGGRGGRGGRGCLAGERGGVGTCGDTSAVQGPGPGTPEP